MELVVVMSISIPFLSINVLVYFVFEYRPIN